LRFDRVGSGRAGEGEAQLVIAFFAQPPMAGRLVCGQVSAMTHKAVATGSFPESLENGYGS
jgi:hypothetical protein